jgi:plasmid stabilization system protein ParE
MKRTIVFRLEAEHELEQAYLWYESRRVGLGADFLLCIEAALASISRSPEMYPVVHRSVRRALIRRFPFGVFYIAEQERVVVLAIFHAFRDPDQLRSRE